MQSRRNFIGNVATGLAGTIATGSRMLGANERIRIGVLGYGDRGKELAFEASNCPGAEIVAVSDIYARRRDEASARFPQAKSFSDFRQLLDDASVDAVLIATPQHLHREHFIAALDSGKHVYQEKTMAFTVEDAKLMRAAYRKAGKRTVQIGHQACSSGQVSDAVRFLQGDCGKATAVGKITAIHAHMYRNTPHGKPQWSRPLYPDMTPENVGWKDFVGNAPETAFDANRYINWRYFWDYSGGNVHENMCQQIAFWYKVLGLHIPHTVSMSGGIYLWKDGREVPDTMAVAMEHGEEILFSWDSGFGNNQLGVTEDVLGTDGTISRGQQIRYLPQKVNHRDGVEVLGQAPTAPRAHMQNFLDCIRTGKEPNCPFEIGYRVSITCRMAVESYRQARTQYWDPVNEEIVTSPSFVTPAFAAPVSAS